MNTCAIEAVEFFFAALRAEKADYDHKNKAKALAIVRALCCLGKMPGRTEALVEAESMAESCDSLRQPEARFLIADAYARHGEFSKALALIQTAPPWIMDGFEFFRAVVGLAVRIAEAGEDFSEVWAKALALAEKKFAAYDRRSWYQRMDFYCALAAAHRKLGFDPDSVIVQARAEARQAVQHGALLELAECENGLGADPSATLRIAGSLSLPIHLYGIDPQVRWMEHLIKLDCLVLAEPVVEAVSKKPDPRRGSSRVEAVFCALYATGLACKGLERDAENWLGLAETHAFAIKYDEPNKHKQYHIEAVLYLVEALARCGRYDRAVALAARVKDASYKHWSDRSQGDGIASIVTCPDDDFRRRAVNLIAKAAAERGDLEAAERIGTTMKWWDGHDPFWLEPFVLALIKAGRLTDARRFCDFFDCPNSEYPKHRCLERIACAYALKGAYAEALLMIQSIPHGQDWEGRRYAAYAAAIETLLG